MNFALQRAALCAAGLLGAVFAGGVRAEDAALPRYPTLHGDHLVFEAHGNLWRVARSGGAAQRLTSDPGFDEMPRYSPDGRWIAFTGEYQGNRDVYVIPAEGGAARRLTFHSDMVEEAPLRWGPDNMVVTWTPDSKNIVFLSRRDTFNTWFGRHFTVPVEGGAAQRLPLDKGGFLTYAPDGHRIAYERIFRNFRTWKRYDGGLAQDVWIYDFDTEKVERVTDWKGNDNQPMWFGDTIYFVSDRDANRRMNIWACDLRTRQFRQITHFTDYDVDFASLGDSGLVFQDGGSLYVLDLPSEQLHKLEVQIPDDGTRTGLRSVDAGKTIEAADQAQGFDLDVAPNGKRAVFGARGEIFTLPREHGNTRDLTQTSSANEEHPAWSPDGRTLAYFTDASGESQLALRPAEGGEEKLLTHFKNGYFYHPLWAPGSDKLAFSDNEHQLWIIDIKGDSKSGEPQKIAQDAYQEIHDYAWSPDGLWLAYSLTEANEAHSLYLYSLATHKATRISDGIESDLHPAFDHEGKNLYFLSARHVNPTFSQSEQNIATLRMFGLYAIPLEASAPSPFAPQSDEGVAKDDDKKKGKDQKTKSADDSEASGAIKPIHIDLEKMMARAVAVPMPPANYDQLKTAKGKLFFLAQPDQTLTGPLAGEQSALHVYDLDKRKDATLVEGLDGYALSADGSAVVYKKDKDYYIADTKPPEGDKPAADKPPGDKLDLSHLTARIEPRAEWAEIFAQAWRLERDFFFNPKMNGVDWPGVRARYEKLLPLAGSREDLNYLIGEMLGELGNSHTYVGDGDFGDERKKVPTAVLGADFALDAASGLYRFAKIYRGDNTREELRSPLTQPGVDVREGDVLLAVDGVELKAPADPYRAFVGKTEGTIRLRIEHEGKRREVVVEPLKNELELRLKDWIDQNRAKVDQASNGQIGYLYLSDMGERGMNQFVEQFYPQIRKQGLIVDVRFNGGGFIDQILLERLRRILVGMDATRQGTGLTTPGEVQLGYKACLINEYSASDGDIFPFYFRKYGLGPLIGKRTWGGVRGIRGEWKLADGGYITIPEVSVYGLDSQWVIENQGVAPDIEVDDEPGDVLADRDVQLQTAVDLLMQKIKAAPKTLPPTPALLPAYPPVGHD